MKISNKGKLRQIASNNLSDMYSKDFMNLYRKCTAKPYSFLIIDNIYTTLHQIIEKESFKNNIKTNHDN